MDFSASRTVHGERKVERVENDHFSGEAGRHRHPEHWTPDHNVRHKWSLAERRRLSRCKERFRDFVRLTGRSNSESLPH